MARRRFFVDNLRNGIAELHGEEAWTWLYDQLLQFGGDTGDRVV